MQSIRPRAPTGRSTSLPIQTRKPWGGLGTSVILHLGLVLLLVGVARKSEKRPEDVTRLAPEAVPVQMVYLPPAPRPRPAPQPQPDPETRAPARPPAPDAVRAPVPERALSRQPDEDQPPAPVSTPEPKLPQPDPVEPAEIASRTPEPAEPRPETLEEQAKRLFGRPVLDRGTRAPRQLGIHPGASADRDQAERTNCTPPPRDPNAPKEMAELVGRVYNSNSRPLAGAFLQIVGTAYSTYSDATGLYRLVFDASLVDECRTQYVRVIADGYRGRNLILGVGPGVNDVILNR